MLIWSLQEYVGPESDASDCQHHPGIPIFHEGWAFEIETGVRQIIINFTILINAHIIMMVLHSLILF